MSDPRHRSEAERSMMRGGLRPLARVTELLSPILGLSAVMLGVDLLNQRCDYFISESAGVSSRTLLGLLGVICAPFVHASSSHMINNALSFMILGTLVRLRGLADFTWVTLTSIIGSGLGTWFLGRGSVTHVGASGLIFGYIGFLIAINYFERKLKYTLIVLIGLWYFRNIFLLLFPNQTNISWEMHLLGFMSGVWAALTTHKLRRKPLGSPSEIGTLD